jgi:hypothetical protein
VAVDDQQVVIGEGRGRFGALDGAGELALGGVVLEEVREVVGRHEIVDRDDVEFFAE